MDGNLDYRLGAGLLLGPTKSGRLETGKVEEVVAPPTIRPAVSPDGRFIAHYWMTPQRWVLAVTPTGGGVPTAILPVAPTHHERVVRWSPDGQSLAFIDGVGGAANIWLEGIDHQSRQKLTHFTDGMISSFDWSRDGLKLAWMRVQEVRDVVAIALKGPES